MSTVAPDPQTLLFELEAADRLLVQQVFKPIANEYRIGVPTPGSAEEGRPLLFVKQKKLKIKEDNFVLRRDGREVGTYKRVLGKLRDRYVLELQPEGADVDRRLLVAFAVGLDALQDR
jgi:hypothetical protein